MINHYDPNQPRNAEGEWTDAGAAIQMAASDKKLLAPNGKKSNLNKEDYKMVRTDEFKSWFGDWENDPKNASKIVDENGEPMVVYHGTKSNFTQFDLSKTGSNNDFGMWGTGFYFSPARKFSQAYGQNEMQCFLSIKNPYIIKQGASNLPKEFKPTSDGKIFSDALRERFIGSGYDGVIQWETGEKPKLTQIIAFEPTQIKIVRNKLKK